MVTVVFVCCYFLISRAFFALDMFASRHTFVKHSTVYHY